MTKSEWKARFVDFLNERNAYSNYITAIRTHAISYKDAIELI